MEVVAKRNPQRVPKVFVIGRHLTQGGQQMPNMAGARTPCQGIGRSAFSSVLEIAAGQVPANIVNPEVANHPAFQAKLKGYAARS